MENGQGAEKEENGVIMKERQKGQEQVVVLLIGDQGKKSHVCETNLATTRTLSRYWSAGSQPKELF